jgi:hypothetical protein
VFDHAPLQGVARDTEQLGRFDDASCPLERLLTQRALCFAQVQVFEQNRHNLRIREKSRI